MVTLIRKKLADSVAARWIVLFAISFTMLTGYIITDVMSPLKTMLEQQLGWDSSDFGIFNFGYGMFNVFLMMLIFAGMILDKKGARFTGLLAIALMLIGTSLKYWAISTDFAGAITSPTIFGWQIFAIKSQVFYTTLGFAIFGVGIEMIGITATKIVVKWFTGKSLALALGLNVAAGRIGTALATAGAIPVANFFHDISAPLALCLVMLCIGLLSFILFVVLDSKRDRQVNEGKQRVLADDEVFHASNILKIARIRAFWYITILCLLFYSAVFPFLKFATELMIQKFSIDPSYAGMLLSLLPFGNMLLTPIFGSIYDRRGRGATIMIIGAVLLVIVHVLFSIPMLTQGWVAVALMITLGAAFSLVPSAMWPSVPKIIPYNMLGTAYSMIFWLQNWGLAGVPLLIGWVLDKYCNTGNMIEIDGVLTTEYNYSLPMMIFAGFGTLSIIFALLLKREDAKKGYGLEKPNIEKK